jgi:ClpX C4-type zinc finger
MSIDEEIAMTAPVVEAARDNAAEHIQRAKEALHLDSVALAHYTDFLNATIFVAESTIAHCRKLASIQEIPFSESTQIVHGLMDGVRESVRTLYVVMAAIEQMVTRPEKRDTPQEPIPETTAHHAIRSCAFCGKSEMQTKLVAGPAGNICAACTRLACGVLGIRLSDNVAE